MGIFNFINNQIDEIKENNKRRKEYEDKIKVKCEEAYYIEKEKYAIEASKEKARKEYKR